MLPTPINHPMKTKIEEITTPETDAEEQRMARGGCPRIVSVGFCRDIEKRLHLATQKANLVDDLVRALKIEKSVVYGDAKDASNPSRANLASAELEAIEQVLSRAENLTE